MSKPNPPPNLKLTLQARTAVIARLDEPIASLECLAERPPKRRNGCIGASGEERQMAIRIIGSLEGADIMTFGDLLATSPKRFQGIPAIGEKCFELLQRLLNRMPEFEERYESMEF